MLKPDRFFKKRTEKPSFILSVLINTFRTLMILILAVSLAGVGAVIGIARAYVDTAPSLDLAAIDLLSADYGIQRHGKPHHGADHDHAQVSSGRICRG